MGQGPVLQKAQENLLPLTSYTFGPSPPVRLLFPFLYQHQLRTSPLLCCDAAERIHYSVGFCVSDPKKCLPNSFEKAHSLPFVPIVAIGTNCPK